MSPSGRRTVGCLVVAVVVLVAVITGVLVWSGGKGVTSPVPGQQRCVVTAGSRSVAVDLDQAHYASVIAGLSMRRGLPARAATIALTTAYQESGIRNLDYGDRDSVGLFQQRPSQGWGTERQLQDPYYATGKFYDALVKVKNWRTDDVNDVAQKVQRSGYPEAYRDHEADARVLASALTGQSPAGLTCLFRSPSSGTPQALVKALKKTLGPTTTAVTDRTVLVTADSQAQAWAYAHFVVANARAYAVTSVKTADQQWTANSLNLPDWVVAAEPIGPARVEITLG